MTSIHSFKKFCKMQLSHLLLTFLLAFAGTDFLVAMHTYGAAGTSGGASSTSTHNEEHNFEFDYEEGIIGRVRNGSSGKPTELLLIDMHERDEYNSAYFLESKNVQIRLGNQQLNCAKHEHKLPPYATKIALTLDEQQNSGLEAPKDLEVIRLEIVYGFVHRVNSYHHWAKLSNGKDEKKVVIKIPKMENAPTEEEKDILKAIFIGGHKFRVEVEKDGNAEIKFQKNFSPGTLKFTADFRRCFPFQTGQMLEASCSVGQNNNVELEQISLAQSTFSINWANAGIKEAEELRTVTISIIFKLNYGNYKLSNEDKKRLRPRFSISIPFRDLETHKLEQIFVGGEGAIHLSTVDGKIEVVSADPARHLRR